MSLQFDRETILGQGDFGIVFKGVCNEKPVAVKRIQLASIVDEREEGNLRSLDHPNVIKLLHAESDLDFRYYVLELCSASLDQLFLKDVDPKKYKGPMPPQDQVLLQLASGLEYIHKMKLIHRDVKPTNVLISTENELVAMKWADFGLSKQVNDRGTHTMSAVQGTFQWMAPEILQMFYDDDNSLSENGTVKRGTVKSDVFSQGLVFGYFLSNGQHPFGSNTSKIQSDILKNKKFNITKIPSQLLRELVSNMLTNQPRDRMTSSDVVQQLKAIQKVELKEKENKFFVLCEEKNPDLKQMNNLLEKGVDINCTNQQGLTPLLHLLAYQKTINHDNLFEIVTFFIEKGANVNCKNDYGENGLLKLCVSYNKDDLIDIVRLFIKHGVDVNCQNKYGEHILFYLGQYYSNSNLIDIFKLLIEHHIDIHMENEYGFNALPVLCRNYSQDNLIDLVRFFNNDHVDDNKRNNEVALQFLFKYYKKDNKMDVTRLLTNPAGSSPQKRKHDE